MGIKRETEETFQQAVIDLFCMHGFAVYHTRNSKGSEPGYPDLSCVKPPRHVYAELKTLTGAAGVAQKLWAQKLAACGHEVYWWRPDAVSWDEIRRVVAGEVVE